jgi:hypothetical protein
MNNDATLRAEVFSYADIVSYQIGSIVSQTIIDAPAGNGHGVRVRCRTAVERAHGAV